MKKLIRLSVFLLGIPFLLISINSCVSSTMVTGTWEKPDLEQSYDNIIVAAMVPTVSTRSSIEMKVVKHLEEEDVEASQSIDVLPPRYIDDDDTKQEIMNSIRNNGADGILTVSLIDKETETRYVRGTTPYTPYPHYGFYGSFWGYYNYWYPRFYDQGYYTEEKIYYIETNLYDADSENLIWSAQSKTYDPVDLENFSEDFAEAIVEQLNEAGII